VPEQPAPIFIGALTPGIKQKATSVRLSNPSFGLLESGKVGRQKKMTGKYLNPSSSQQLFEAEIHHRQFDL
jgi:hypothetical protein